MYKIIFILWRYSIMKKQAMNVAKSIGAGVATGMIVGFVGSKMIGNDRRSRKKARKTLDSVGQVIDDIKYIFK